MKIAQISQRPLIESYIRNNDAKTSRYMQVMNENFVIPFNKSLLNEVALDANTINQIFTHAEIGMTNQGANRTALGKGADVAGAVGGAAAAGAEALGKGAVAAGQAIKQGAGQAVDLAKQGASKAVDLGKQGMAKVKELSDKLLNQHKAKFEQSLPPADAGEVQNFEQQANQAAEQIQDPKAKKSVMDLIKQGVKNPVTQTLILTAVGSIAAVVAGPAIAGLGLGAAATGALTGTVVGGLTKLVQAKMQGKDWKEAGKDALKGAAMGAAVGGIGGGIVQGAQAAADAYRSHQQQQLPVSTDNPQAYSGQGQTGEFDPGAGKDWGGASADPNAPAGYGFKNPDGSPMTNAQVKAAADRVAPVAGGDADPNKYYNSLSADQQRATDDAIVAQARANNPDFRNNAGADPSMAGQTGADFAGVRDANGVAPYATGSAQWKADMDAGKLGQADTGATDATFNQTFAGSKPPVQNQNVSDSDFSQAEINAPIKPSADVQNAANQEAAKYGRVRPNLDDWRAANILAKGRGMQTQSRLYTSKPIVEYIDKEQTARRWILQESLGRNRSGYVLTDEAIQYIFEGPITDWFKKVGSNLTNKVTADKLKQAWNKEGMPNDSDAIAGILTKAGVGQTVVQDIFKQLGIPTTAQTGAKAPEKPGQGMLGKITGAVGGAIGGAKGAIAGAKDAYQGGKASGFDSARANQAGDALGATGEQNPYTQQAQAGGDQGQAQGGAQGTSQQPSYGQGQAPQAYGVAPRSTQTTQPSTQSTGGASGTVDSGNDVNAFGAVQTGADAVGDAIAKKGTQAADVVNDLNRAVQSGRGMGASGQSLVRGPYAPGGEGAGKDSLRIRDEFGQDHAYKKVGQKWFDKDNKEVPAAIAAMLNKQSEQQAALAKDKTPATQQPQAQGQTTPATATGKAKPTPATQQPQAQGQSTPATQPPQGQPTPATATGKAKPTPATQQPQAQGQPTPATQQPQAQGQGQTTPATQQPQAQGQSTPATQQPQAQGTPQATDADSAALQKSVASKTDDQLATYATRDLDPAVRSAVAAEIEKRKAGGQQPTPATQQPQAQAGAQQPTATGQSPEEIRKAKQSGAATAANAEMDANAQAAQAGGVQQPAAKTHTGGKVAGQVSQTPNAIRKREQRAAAKQAKSATNDVMARMAKQLAPATTPAATPNFGTAGMNTGYGKTTYNVPTSNVPVQPAVQPTTAAKAVPVKEPAATPAASTEKFSSRGIPGMDSAPTTAPAAPAAETPGYLTSKIQKGGYKAPASEPVTAGIDFSAILARKAKVRL